MNACCKHLHTLPGRDDKEILSWKMKDGESRRRDYHQEWSVCVCVCVFIWWYILDRQGKLIRKGKLV